MARTSDYPEAEAFLRSAWKLDMRIDAKNERLHRLRALAEKTTPTYGGEVVSHSRNVTAREDVIVRVMEAEAELNTMIDELLVVRTETDRVLSLISDTEVRTLLEMRYLNHDSISRICTAANYERTYVYRTLCKGLSMVEVILHTLDSKCEVCRRDEH